MAGDPLASTWIVAALALNVVRGRVLGAGGVHPGAPSRLRRRIGARSGAPLTPEFTRPRALLDILGWPAFIALAIRVLAH
jgi:uncharacterized membrane protein